MVNQNRRYTEWLKAATLIALLCSGQLLAADLDDVTMRVIGLEEIPGDSFKIEIPHSAIDEMATISELKGAVPGRQIEDALITSPITGGTVPPPQE